MIADLKPYPEYKESGLTWAKQVPSHWILTPNRAHLRVRKVLVGDRYVKLKLLSLTKRGVIVRDLTEMKGKFSSDLGTSQEVRIGDLVLCLFDVPETPRTVGLSKFDGMITSAYTVMECRDQQTVKFIELFYIAMDDRKMLAPLYSGLRNTIPKGRFLGVKTPLPPLSEQAAIVRFLSWVNGRLEQAIRTKQKIIALLAEQKQAIIHCAVTRGLDPAVRFKDSGIPWLGKIPEHWEVIRTRYLFRETDERSTTGHECHLSMSQKLGLVPAEEVTSSLQSDSYINGKVCKIDDLVLNRLKAHLGVFAIAKQVGVISPDYSVFRKSRSLNMKYYELILRGKGCRGELFTRSKGIVEGFWRLYTDDFYNIKLPMPPLQEQNEIVSALETEIKSIEIPIARLEREIELLQEYRIRLVADVVTGRLDVREAAGLLPDDVQLEEIMEDELDGGDEAEEIKE